MVKGLHHVSMKCGTAADLERAKAFYCGVLGLTVKRRWPEGIMLDAGNGLIEIFSNGAGERGKGAVRHFALSVDSVDLAAQAVERAGYRVFLAPKDIVIDSAPPCPARIAFCTGPLGEEIELFQELEELN